MPPLTFNLIVNCIIHLAVYFVNRGGENMRKFSHSAVKVMSMLSVFAIKGKALRIEKVLLKGTYNKAGTLVLSK